MESGLRWHGFTIYHDGAQFVAQVDMGDDPVLEIGSQSVDRLIAMIDEYNHYNNHLSSGDLGFTRAPAWLREWYENIEQIELSDRISLFTGELVVARVNGDRVFTRELENQPSEDEEVELLRKRWREFEDSVSAFMRDKPIKFKFDLLRRPEVQIIECKNFVDVKTKLFSHSMGGLLIKGIARG